MTSRGGRLRLAPVAVVVSVVTAGTSPPAEAGVRAVRDPYGDPVVWLATAVMARTASVAVRCGRVVLVGAEPITLDQSR